MESLKQHMGNIHLNDGDAPRISEPGGGYLAGNKQSHTAAHPVLRSTAHGYGMCVLEGAASLLPKSVAKVALSSGACSMGPRHDLCSCHAT